MTNFINKSKLVSYVVVHAISSKKQNILAHISKLWNFAFRGYSRFFVILVAIATFDQTLFIHFFLTSSLTSPSATTGFTDIYPFCIHSTQSYGVYFVTFQLFSFSGLQLFVFSSFICDTYGTMGQRWSLDVICYCCCTTSAMDLKGSFLPSSVYCLAVIFHMFTTTRIY